MTINVVREKVLIMNNSKSRNNYIELLRFIFCMIILIHHAGFVSPDGSSPLPSGGVIGDAFFMLTGYFACAHIVKMKDKPDKKMAYSIRYTINKLIKVLPYAGVGIIIAYLFDISHIQGGTSVGDMLSRLYNMIVELLLLPMAGIMKTDLISFRNAPLWYLSATLVSLPLVMYLAIACEDLYKNYLIWFLPLFLQGWMVRTFGGALPWMDYSGIVYSGAVRGFSSMTMGFGIYYAVKALTKKLGLIEGGKKVMLTIAELAIFALLLLNIYRGISGYDEIATIYVAAGMLTLALSGLTYTSSINAGFFSYLGRLSLPIYCVHWGVYKWVSAHRCGTGYLAAVLVTFAISAVISIVMIKLLDMRAAKKA